MNVEPLELNGVLLITPDVYRDPRGYFLETWNRARYAQAGLPDAFAQSNVSRSSRGILRGLHYQNPNPQGKLVYVLEGEVFDVAVDIRLGSPTYGRWTGARLTAAGAEQLYVPPGFAHGFCVLSESALFCYLCTVEYDPKADAAIRWDDPDIGIEWPIDAPSLSTRDAQAPRLRSVPRERLPHR